MTMVWTLTSAVPVIGVVLMVLAHATSFFPGDARKIRPVSRASLTALFTGVLRNPETTMMVVDLIG